MARTKEVLFLVVALLAACLAIECGPRVRKSWHSLTKAERDLYVDALLTAYDSGMYKTMCEIHFQNFSPSHNEAPFFLPWHRYFIYIFENLIREQHPRFACFTIPYWPWESTSYLGTAHIFNPDYLGSRVDGCVQDGKFTHWWNFTKHPEEITPPCVLRTWPDDISVCGEACTMELIVKHKDFKKFFPEYEDIAHKSAHKLVGGIVNGAKSTYDPIFWMLHSSIDRQWALWEDCHNHDLVPAWDLGENQYHGKYVGDIFQTMDTCMPFFHKHKVHHYFPECITARMVHHIQGNTMTPMEYAYGDENNLISIIDANFGRCQWDWYWHTEGYDYYHRSQHVPYDEFESNWPEFDDEWKKRAVLQVDGQELPNHATLEYDGHQVQVSWAVRNDEITLKLEAETNKEAWIGLGWGGSDHMMTDADMVCSSKSGNTWEVHDYYSSGYEKPNRDNKEHIFGTSAGFSNGKSWMIFSRKLKAADKQDKSFSSGPFELAFAVGYSGEFNSHKYAGHQAVTLIEGSGDENDDVDSETKEKMAHPVWKNEEYFNREFGSCLPKEQLQYVVSPGHFGNVLVEEAKRVIDRKLQSSFSFEARDPVHRVRLLHIAECQLQNVEFYAEAGSFIFPPACQVEDLPFSLSLNYTPCDSEH